MPRFLIKLPELNSDASNKYLIWSTVVDAPVSYPMSKEEILNEYREEPWNYGLGFSPEKAIEQADSYTISKSLYSHRDELLNFNRAGPNEESLDTWEKIIKHL